MVLKLECHILSVEHHADGLLLLEQYALEKVCGLLGKDERCVEVYIGALNH